MKNMNMLAKAITLGIMLSTPVLTYADAPIVNSTVIYDEDTVLHVEYQDLKNYGHIVLMNKGETHTIGVNNGKELKIEGFPRSSEAAVAVKNGSTLNFVGNVIVTNLRDKNTIPLGLQVDGSTVNIEHLTLNTTGKGVYINSGKISGDNLDINITDNSNAKRVEGMKVDRESIIDTVTTINIDGGGIVSGGISASDYQTGDTIKMTSLNMEKPLTVVIKNVQKYARGIYLSDCTGATNFNGIDIIVDGGTSLESNDKENDPGSVGVYFKHGKAQFNDLTKISVKNNTERNNGLYITQDDNGNYEQSNITMDVAEITATGGKKAIGVELINSSYKLNQLESTVNGASDENIGVWVKNGHMESESVKITVSGSYAQGLVIAKNKKNQKHDNTDNKTSIKNLVINAESDASNRTYGIYFDNSKDSSLEVENANITVRNTDENRAYAISSGFNANMTFKESVIVDAKKAIYSVGYNDNPDKKDANIIDVQKNFYSKHKDSVIGTMQNAIVHINSTGLGTVEYSGIIDNQAYFDESWDEEYDKAGKAGTINFNMNNAVSYWNLTGNSRLNTLNIANGAKLDMTADGNKFSTLSVKTLNGDKTSENTIHMDIDAATNKDNSDRVYVDGTHTGNHYITLNNVGANTDGAEGTVLVSVKDEQGTFKANDSEGTLYWNKYKLNIKDSAEQNYKKDWYLEKVEIITPDEKPTTSVDTVMSVNSLNYHTWRTENDKLLQRMGELRHNGEEEKGAWFRVKGSKIGYDGEFENKYTTYELGYDEVTKRTEDMVRYQGAALSYVDGDSSYNNGSGDNHGKSIGFYTTEQYSKGHYLDLVFKISNMDNDFKVFDTNGNKITGEYDNTGVSISAEYGRKNDLDNGWYIEPQAQLTLGYMGGASYETNNGISVDQSGIKSALGRIGFNIGKKIGEKGIVYAKANLLHEFGGGYDVEMRAADGSLTMSNTYNDTWFEYGIGVAMATGDNSHIYFDVERSTGSDFYKDWQWNAGMRWNF